MPGHEEAPIPGDQLGLTGNQPARVRAKELYPLVEEERNLLEQIKNKPPFTSEVIEAFKKMAEQGYNVIGERITLGENPQVLTRLEIRPPDATGEVRVRFTESQEAKPKGDRVFADFHGRFKRRKNPTDEKPIAQKGDELEAEAPIGVAQVGKTRYPYRLPKEKFPNGGIIVSFEIEEEADVEPDSTICYVKKK